MEGGSKAVVCSAPALSTGVSFSAEKNCFYHYGASTQAMSDRKASADAAVANLGITAFTSRADDTDTTYEIQGGCRINRHFAVETGHPSLGEYSYYASLTVPIVAARDSSLKIEGGAAGMIARIPFSTILSALAKADVKAGAFGLGYRFPAPMA